MGKVRKRNCFHSSGTPLEQSVPSGHRSRPAILGKPPSGLTLRRFAKRMMTGGIYVLSREVGRQVTLVSRPF